MSKPTESEMEILQALWRLGPSTVRSVNHELNKTKSVGYTTTLKLLQIMTRKGLVLRNEERRTHVYEACISEATAQNRLLTRFLDTAFGGSASKLVLQALGNHKTSKEELQAIRKLLDEIEGEDT